MPARLLIGDHRQASADALEGRLVGEYYDVLTAGDGEAALDAIRRHQPDLVLVHEGLLGIDGIEVCRRVKSEAATVHVPVIVLTDDGGRGARNRALEAGADEVLVEPVDDETLFARVRSLVRLNQILDQWRLRGETTEKMGFPANTVPTTSDDGCRARIALVDDDREECAAVGDVLTQDHDHVVVIGSFKDATNRIIRSEPDAVIVALAAAGEDPLRFCSSMRSLDQTRALPILLVGGADDRVHLIKALELGVNDFIRRPLDGDELRARVRNLVRRKRYQDHLRTSFLNSLSMALTDALTGLHNRRYLSTHLDALFRRTVDRGKPLAVLMIDIDRFKRVNDTHGHAVGDGVLCDIAQSIARNVRAFDLVARYGGEEFVVVMPDTPQDVAYSVAERLRKKIADEPIVVADEASPVAVSVSIGISHAEAAGDSSGDLLKRADKALYQAKREGRNRVVSEAGGSSALGASLG